MRLSAIHNNLAKAYHKLATELSPLSAKRYLELCRLARCHFGQALTLKRRVLDRRHASIAATSYLLACVYVHALVPANY